MARRTALVTLALAALSAGSEASADPVASRLVDRTVVCDMPGVGYPDAFRFMTFSALRSVPAIMSMSNGPDFETRVSVVTGPSGRDKTGSVALNLRDCVASRASVRLSSTALRGGPATRFPKSFECDVPTKVLVRVRAKFKRPTKFSRDRQTPWLVRARGRIVSSSLAITTVQGRPIGFASVEGASGKAWIFTAPSRCTAS